MRIEFNIPDETIQKVLGYGDIILENLTSSDIDKLRTNVIASILSRIEDEPHYAFDDWYVETIEFEGSR